MRLVLVALGRALLDLRILEDDDDPPGAGAEVAFGFAVEEEWEEDRTRAFTPGPRLKGSGPNL